MTTAGRAHDAFLTLRDDIVNLRRPPGVELSEVALASELEISRTPVREALQRLADDGFVILGTRRAATVAPITTDAVMVTYQVREALETYAYALAARSPRRQEFVAIADRLEQIIASDPDDVHEFFATADLIVETLGKVTGNELLADLISMLRYQSHRMLLAGSDPLGEGVAEAGHYVTLLRAVADGDADEAFRLVMTRLIGGMRNALASLRADGGQLLGEVTPPPRG